MGPHPIVFPAPPGTYSYSNDWGAPRRGHSHRGNDIMAPANTPALACAPGTLSFRHTGGTAGLWASLRSDWGDQFWYMHLNGVWDPVTRKYLMATDAGMVDGRLPAPYRVFPGFPFGLIGSTGNASPGAEHIHFEWHPGGGPAQNPYWYLQKYDWRNLGVGTGVSGLFGALLNLDSGGKILADGLAFLHKNEVITKAPVVEKIERMPYHPAIKYYDNSQMTITISGDDTTKMKRVLEDYNANKARAIVREINKRL